MNPVNYDQHDYSELVKKHPAYDPHAFDFVLHVIGVACAERRDHVTAQELLDVFRNEALDIYGPMAYALLLDWGLHASIDVGNVVFALYDAKLIGKRDEDTIADFIDGYDFREAFYYPYVKD